MGIPATKTKQCSVCGEEKPLGQFHRRKFYTRDGRRSACTACTRDATTRVRLAKPPALDPLKTKVRRKTASAVRNGTLVPEPCRCGKIDVQAHHPRYDGPDAHLGVEWLCTECHALEHSPRGRQLEIFATPGRTALSATTTTPRAPE